MTEQLGVIGARDVDTTGSGAVRGEEEKEPGTRHRPGVRPNSDEAGNAVGPCFLDGTNPGKSPDDAGVDVSR